MIFKVSKVWLLRFTPGDVNHVTEDFGGLGSLGRVVTMYVITLHVKSFDESHNTARICRKSII